MSLKYVCNKCCKLGEPKALETAISYYGPALKPHAPDGWFQYKGQDYCPACFVPAESVFSSLLGR
jgi:hypothetical protein